MRMLGSKFAGLVIAIALGVSTAADAQTVRWKEYLHPEKPAFKEFNQLYLAGVRDGLISYSVAAHEKLFCLPPTLVLTNEQSDDVMIRWAEKQTASLDSRPIGLILLAALRKEFPCQ
ncbi:Rap1a/Tai family immunity protein [Bradyrhizobium erythrophlei]|uniref:Rap1a/Tai family immunity protein n=1 Tax=Bradyrhizobium erythrophlei TaxID=1437360 RepID=UPI0035EC4C73